MARIVDGIIMFNLLSSGRCVLRLGVLEMMVLAGQKTIEVVRMQSDVVTRKDLYLRCTTIPTDRTAGLRVVSQATASCASCAVRLAFGRLHILYARTRIYNNSILKVLVNRLDPGQAKV
jgi:hypothetical protein